MPAEIHCPKCASASVILSKKHGAFVCEDCGHVLPEAPISPLRIFLSYCPYHKFHLDCKH